MTDIRLGKAATGPEPVLPAHLATKNYVDLRGDSRYALLSSNGQANGYASLDAATKVPVAQLPTGMTATTVAPGNHTHTLAGLSGNTISDLVSGDVLSYDGTAWVNSPRLSTLESLVDSEPTDTMLHGDVVSSTKRIRAVDANGMDNGYYTITSLLSPRTATVTKVRFAVLGAGTAGGTPTVALQLLGGAGPTQNQLATAPMTGATLTSAGIKELTLSAAVNVVAGTRYTLLFYIAPSAFTARPTIAAVANARSLVVNPVASQIYAAYKAASAPPPTSINTSDGSWNGGSNTIAVLWWALL